MRYVAAVAAAGAMFAWWIAYAGRGPMRRVTMIKRLHEMVVRMRSTASDAADGARSLHERISGLEPGGPVSPEELQELSSRSEELAARLDALAGEEPAPPSP